MMKIPSKISPTQVLPVLFLIGCSAVGQQLHFRGSPVDTIIVSGLSGYYHFEKTAKTTGREDIFQIAFDRKENDYRVVAYEKIRKTINYEPISEKENISRFSRFEGKKVSSQMLEKLLNAFSSPYHPPTYQNLGLDTNTFLGLTDARHIRKIAKRYDEGWQFKGAYSTKEENQVIYEGCQHADTFDLFLSAKFDTTGYVEMCDYWDEIFVKIGSSGKYLVFEGKYPNKFKQPWYDHSSTDSTMIPTLEEGKFKYELRIDPVLNFNINAALADLLPDGFFRKNTIEFKALIYQYLKWYLQRREIIHDYE